MMSMSSIIIDKIHSTVRIDSPTHVINLPEQVLKVEMSPFEWSHNLICIAHMDEIVIGMVKFQEEDEEMEEEIEFEVIKSFKIDTRVHSLAWCPETSLNIIPKSVVFACGTANNIYIFSTNLADKTQMQELKGHSSYVNSLAYEPSGDLLASTGDDLTCRLWAVKDNCACITVFVLKSHGVSVCWHNADPGKLLVAERGGTVRLYNVERQQAILSLDTSLVPLTAADWSPVNCFQVAALASGHLVIWDITRSSHPVDVRVVHPGGGSLLRYSHQSEHHVATVGQPDNSLKVTHVNMKHPVCNATMTANIATSYPPYDNNPFPFPSRPPFGSGYPNNGGMANSFNGGMPRSPSPPGFPNTGFTATRVIPLPSYPSRMNPPSGYPTPGRFPPSSGPSLFIHRVSSFNNFDPTPLGSGNSFNTRTQFSRIQSQKSTVTQTQQPSQNRPQPFPPVSPPSSCQTCPSADSSSSSESSKDTTKRPSDAPQAAVAGAAAGALVTKPAPAPPTPAPSPPPTPPTPSATKTVLVPVKCNWCIRPNCNPGACMAAPNFNAMKDAERLKEAIKGAGTTESVLMDILINRSEEQLDMIRHEYLAFGRGMDKDIRGDTSRKVKVLYKKLMKPRSEFFAHELKRAFRSEDYKTAISILSSLSPCAIREVGVAFVKKRKHKQTLKEAAEEASKYKLEEFLVELVNANREQGEKVDIERARKDAENIKNAAGLYMPDKRVFIDIFTHRSFAHIRKVKELFNQMGTAKDFDKTIAEETGGDKLTEGLQAVMANIEDQPGYFAKQIDEALGKFTDDDPKLALILRGRCGIDLGDIVKAYNEKHKKTLADEINSRKYGDYKASLVRIVTPQKVD